MSVEIAWKQNNLVTDFHLLKLLQVVFGFGLQTFICDFSRQNICSLILQFLFSGACLAPRPLRQRQPLASFRQVWKPFIDKPDFPPHF